MYRLGGEQDAWKDGDVVCIDWVGSRTRGWTGRWYV